MFNYFFLLRLWFHFVHRDCCWRWILSDYPIGGGMFEKLRPLCSKDFKAYFFKWNMNIFQNIDPRSALSLQAKMSSSLQPVDWWWTLLKHMPTMRTSSLRRSDCVWYVYVCLYRLHLVWSHTFISCRLCLTCWFLSERGKGPFLQPSLIDWR